jgi:predicted nucleotidyltransferase component of viral defense system
MKDYCLELVSKEKSYNAKLNIMREYLQAYILRIMQNEKISSALCFLGGTALRFLYGLPRFSEDLDFSISKEKHFSFLKFIKKLKDELVLAGYNVSLSYNDKKAVQYAFIKFSELMYEAKISPLKEQKFSIKIEVDTNPPQGALLRTDIINKYFPLSFLSYELSSLFAGKLHALLSINYTKGRDFFDLGWYLSKWKSLSPNVTLLQNALKQTGWKDEFPSQETWRKFVVKAVKNANWEKVEKDVENFLENPLDLNIFTKENVLKLIEQI